MKEATIHTTSHKTRTKKGKEIIKKKKRRAQAKTNVVKPPEAGRKIYGGS